MTGAPEVSVVIPTRNRAQLLATTLTCVLRQRDVHLEVVIVDDGSTDGTPASAAAIGDARVRVVALPRREGQSHARNRGIAEATGRWVAFLDDDDLWSPDKLRRQVDALDGEGRPWGYSGAVDFLPGPQLWAVVDPPSADELARGLPHDNVVPAGASNVIADRGLLEAIGGFDTALTHLTDWDLWLKLLRAGPPAVVHRHDVAYRLHDTNLALTTVEGIFDEVAVLDGRTRDLRDGAPLDPTPVRNWLAVTFWRAGRRTEARRMYREALRGGHRRAGLRLARSYVPVQRLRPSFLRRGGSDWPPGVERWLRAALDR